MKNISFFLIAIFALKNSDAQKIVVANTRMNIVYLGIPNPIIAIAEGYKATEIELQCSEGKVEKNEEDGYVYFPEKQGKVLFEVISKKAENKILGSM